MGTFQVYIMSSFATIFKPYIVCDHGICVQTCHTSTKLILAVKYGIRFYKSSVHSSIVEHLTGVLHLCPSNL